jgi:hypothetical protein
MPALIRATLCRMNSGNLRQSRHCDAHERDSVGSRNGQAWDLDSYPITPAIPAPQNETRTLSFFILPTIIPPSANRW